MSDLLAGMSDDEKKELIGEFLSESESHLQVLNDKLLLAEENVKVGQTISDADLNAMMRSAHTLKGTASFIGLNKIVQLMHDMESVMQKIKSGKINLDPEVTEALFKAFDSVELLFKNLKSKGKEEGDITASVEKLQVYIDGGVTHAAEAPKQEEEKAKTEPEEQKNIKEDKATKEKKKKQKEEERALEKYIDQFISDTDQSIETFNEVLLIFEKEPNNAERINELFRITHTIKGTAGLVNAVEIQKVSHSMENILSYIRETQKAPTGDIVSQLFEGIDIIKELLVSVKNRKKAEIDISGIIEKLEISYANIKGLVTKPKATTPKEAKNVDSKEHVFNLEQLNNNEKTKLSNSLNEDKDVFGLIFFIDGMIPMKSMKLLLITEKLAKKGNIIFCKPEVKEVDDTITEDLTCAILFCSTINEKDIKELIKLDGIKIDSIERIEHKNSPHHEKVETKTIQHTKEDVIEDEQKGVHAMENIPIPEKVHFNAHAAATTVNSTSAAGGGQGGGNKSSAIEMSTIRVDSNKIDNLMNLSSELVIIRARFAQLVSSLNEEIMNQREVGSAIESIKDTKESLNKEVKSLMLKIKDESSMKKITKYLDELDAKLDGFERTSGSNKVVSAIHSLDEITSSLGKISSDIQSGIMQTRMIPIEGIFTRFKRIVRDISKELGKEVNLKIEGEETELDKKIVDSLGDPLTHMIRNSVDHGIEDKEARMKSGKAEIGTILLKASHRGNNICIEVGDDGRGLDGEKILNTAIKKGIIKPEDIPTLNERQKIDLIFLPGFSTAEKVTGISGRGVGMDVVKSMITSVNGTIDIVSELGKGSNFILKIPLTLAIIQALLVVIGNEIYALPLDSVLEIIKVSEEEIYSIDGNDTVKLRGHALSLIELEKVIKLTSFEERAKGSRRIVVISDGEQQVGVVVDSLLGKDEIVIKSLTDHFAGVKGITGASILGDGRIALILDPATIIREAR